MTPAERALARRLARLVLKRVAYVDFQEELEGMELAITTAISLRLESMGLNVEEESAR